MARSDYMLLKQYMLHRKQMMQLMHQRMEEEPEEEENIQMVETRLYVGLNDSETKRQLFETERYLDQLKEICFKYHVPFSVDTEEGGYFHDSGEYVEENTLVLTLIDAERETIEKIAKDLRTLFNQESILITENDIKGFYLT